MRSAGVDPKKMDEIILDYARRKGSLLGREDSRTDFNARMGIEAISKGLYRPDRASSLEGTGANIREKLRLMKDLGLVRRDDFATDELRQYVRILEDGDAGKRLDFLQRRIARWKLVSPQGSQTAWSPRQNGYKHYRIRPGVMLLYAAERAEKRGVEIDTDDVVLSASRFFTPNEVATVDEVFLQQHIRDYFTMKKRRRPDYRRSFERLMDRVERDLGTDLRKADKVAFQRKCRNAANEAYCLIIMMRNAGLVRTKKISSSRIGHWSASQQSYEHTPPVPELNVLRITDDGRRLLAEALERLPVWYVDIAAVSSHASVASRIAFLVNELAQGVDLKRSKLTLADLKRLKALGITGKSRGGMYVPHKRPVFSLQHDMP